MKMKMKVMCMCVLYMHICAMAKTWYLACGHPSVGIHTSWINNSIVKIPVKMD